MISSGGEGVAVLAEFVVHEELPANWQPEGIESIVIDKVLHLVLTENQSSQFYISAQVVSMNWQTYALGAPKSAMGSRTVSRSHVPSVSHPKSKPSMLLPTVEHTC